jgi:hypothetical protein
MFKESINKGEFFYLLTLVIDCDTLKEFYKCHSLLAREYIKMTIYL